MEKIMTSLFLSALLSVFLVSTDAAVHDNLGNNVTTDAGVLDNRGNNVTTDASYYIEIDGITYFQKLTLRSINGSCARYVGYGFQQAIPVRFRPYRGGNTINGGHGDRFRIEFTSAPSCAGSGEWTEDDSSYVVAGVNDPKLGRNYFAVLQDEESGKYVLGSCGPCALCRNFCSPIGLDSDAFLKTNVEKPLKVFFRKAA